MAPLLSRALAARCGTILGTTQDDAASDLAGAHVRRRVTDLLAAGSMLVVGCVGRMEVGSAADVAGFLIVIRMRSLSDWTGTGARVKRGVNVLCDGVSAFDLGTSSLRARGHGTAGCLFLL